MLQSKNILLKMQENVFRLGNIFIFKTSFIEASYTLASTIHQIQ